MAEPAAPAVLEYYVGRVEAAVEEKRELEAKVREPAEAPRRKLTVDALRYMKAVETVTAMALASEVDGFSQVWNASAFSAWLWVVPSKRSSGKGSRRGESQRPATTT